MPAAMRRILNESASMDLVPMRLASAEHADGSGRWHIIAECVGDGGDERTLRVLIEEIGVVGDVTEIEQR